MSLQVGFVVSSGWARSLRSEQRGCRSHGTLAVSCSHRRQYRHTTLCVLGSPSGSPSTTGARRASTCRHVSAQIQFHNFDRCVAIGPATRPAEPLVLIVYHRGDLRQRAAAVLGAALVDQMVLPRLAARRRCGRWRWCSIPVAAARRSCLCSRLIANAVAA